MIEPSHQPLDPADRADGGLRLPVEIAPASTADHQQAAAAIAAQAFVLCVRQRILPGSISVLLAIRAGHDNATDIAAHTGLSISTVRTATSRLKGTGRYCRSKPGRVIDGTDIPLITSRPHPHATSNGQQQLRLTIPGRQLADALLGDARALAGE